MGAYLCLLICLDRVRISWKCVEFPLHHTYFVQLQRYLYFEGQKWRPLPPPKVHKLKIDFIDRNYSQNFHEFIYKCEKSIKYYFAMEKKIGLSRDLNPGPLAPKARIIPLDHWASSRESAVSTVHIRLCSSLTFLGCFECIVINLTNLRKQKLSRQVSVWISVFVDHFCWDFKYSFDHFIAIKQCTCNIYILFHCTNFEVNIH